MDVKLWVTSCISAFSGQRTISLATVPVFTHMQSHQAFPAHFMSDYLYIRSLDIDTVLVPVDVSSLSRFQFISVMSAYIVAMGNSLSNFGTHSFHIGTAVVDQNWVSCWNGFIQKADSGLLCPFNIYSSHQLGCLNLNSSDPTGWNKVLWIMGHCTVYWAGRYTVSSGWGGRSLWPW